MLSAVLGLVVAILMAAGLLRLAPPSGSAQSVRLLVRRSGLLTWGYVPAGLAVLALAVIGHGSAAMLLAVLGLLGLVALLSAGFLVRRPGAEG
ncbi:MAG: hypothetical protein ACP5PW_04980 [Candidatus Dormibacteria bacterium]